MTTAVAGGVEDAASQRPERSSRLAEFAVVGGMTPFLFPVAWLLRRALGADASELFVGFLCFHAAHVVNDPHFSVTYLLFYENAKERAFGRAWGLPQRARYVVAGFLVPSVLAVWAGSALFARSAVALGWLIQLMFLLVGWHYVKQGFGVLSVLSARRGVAFGAVERRVLLFHSYAAWAYAWASPADPGSSMEERGVVYTSFAHGPLLEHATFWVFMASAVAVLGVLALRLRPGHVFPPLGALAGYLSALWLWTVYSRVEPLVVYVIPALHSLQYLHFVGLLKRSELERQPDRPFALRGNRTRLVLFFATAVGLAWIVFHGVPGLLDAALFSPRRIIQHLEDPLGPAPCVAAVFVCVNIHHYFMDHVLWRRENPAMAALRTAR